MAEEHVFDLLPGYALGSLDEDELIQVARHLPACALCRGELSTYFETADALVQALSLQTPPPALKARIMKQIEKNEVKPPVHESAPRSIGSARSPGIGNFFREWFSQPVGWAVTAVALVLILGLVTSNLLLWQRVNTPQASQQGGNVQLVQMAGTNQAPEAHGYLMVFKNETYGTLVVEDVPQLTPDRQYQLWLIQDGKRTSGGVFSVNEQGYGTLQISATQPLEKFTGFGVTVEPAGGSPGPTGNKVLGGNL